VETSRLRAAPDGIKEVKSWGEEVQSCATIIPVMHKGRPGGRDGEGKTGKTRPKQEGVFFVHMRKTHFVIFNTITGLITLITLIRGRLPLM
jgi:hypothetical protein